MFLRYLGFVLLTFYPELLRAQRPAGSCSAPGLQDGFLNPSEKIYLHNAALNYACNDGLKTVSGGWWATTKCHNGKWLHHPQCIDEKACLSPNIPNANFTKSESGWYEDGATVRITCDDGFADVDRDATAICKNGAWSSVPLCERRRGACSGPPIIPHAVIVNQSYKDVFADDSELHFECEDEYEVKEANKKKSIICIQGTWTKGPECSRKTRSEDTGKPDKGSDTRPGTAQGGTSGRGDGDPAAGGDRDTRPSTGHGSTSGRGDGDPAAGGDRGTRPSTGHGGSSGRGDGGDRDTRPSTGHGGSSGRGDGGDRDTRPSTGQGGSSGRGDGGVTTPNYGHGQGGSQTYIPIDNCGKYPNIENSDVVSKNAMSLKYKCNVFYTLVGPAIVKCLSDGTWSRQPTCKATFCTLDHQMLQQYNILLQQTEFLQHSGRKTFHCLGNGQLSQIVCKNGQLTVTHCCSYYQHYYRQCPILLGGR